MKKVLAMMLSICMIMAFIPAVSFAADVTINANTTAFFTPSGALSTVEGSSESGSSCVLVAWNGSDNWNAAGSFTDTDGSVTSQTATNGTGFGSSRNAVVSFDIPEDFDPDKDVKVTLGLTVRYVKQISDAGARLAVYGNSIDGKWTTSTAISAFGASGSDSGLGGLTLLGLTTPISMAGNNQVDETVTLSSLKLTEYVKEMALEGKTQVTFRLAIPHGGVWIYNSSSSHPATLSIEEGKVTSITVKTVYLDEAGNELEYLTEESVVNSVLAGSTYTYTEAIKKAVELEEGIFVYSEENSALSTVVAEDGTSEIIIAYKKDGGELTFSGYEVDDEGAWCWFADPRSISYKNDEGTLDFTILGYIDVHGNIKATQIDHLTDTYNEILIRSNIQPDDHNNPTFLVLPDERIIVFYSRHTDEACFWYRVTEEKGDLTTLGEEKCLNTSANTTYPSPFLMEDDPDHIYLMWRGINWHPTIAKLSLPDENGNTQFTYGPYQMVQSTAARPYAKYSSNGKDKLYVTYTLGHPDNEANNWVFFNQINISDMTLEDVHGNRMTTIANGVLNVNASNQSQTHIVDAVSMRDWVWQVAKGNDGNPVIAMVRINGSKTSHDYYYVKWNGTEWVKTFLANGGGHFHQTAGLEMCYSGGMAIDPDNTNVMYCSVPVEGAFGRVYEIIKYTMSDDGREVIETEQITYNSLKNNVRPFVIPNSEDKDVSLIWMNGDYYDWIVSNAYGANGYCTRVVAEAPLPAEEVDLSDFVALENYIDIDGDFVSTKETANVVEAEAQGEFTVHTEIYLAGDYEGTLFDIGDVKVSVETMNTQYGATAWGDRARVVVTVDGVDYVSSNVYGSSDCWKTYGRGTGGNYGVENYQGYVSHTLTYDGSYLTLYREGLVDIKIPAEGLSVNDVTVGGFDGQVTTVMVWDRALNHDEIKNRAEAEHIFRVPDYVGDEVVIKKYVDEKGNELLPSEDVTLNKGSEVYNFVPVETIRYEDAIYGVKEIVNSGDEYTAIYEPIHSIGKNLIYNGDMSETTVDNGYTYVTGWQGGYTNSTHHELSDRPYLYESGAWMATTNAHFIYTPAADGEKAYVTTPAASTMNSGADYPWKSDVNEPYMGAVLTSWMKDGSDVNSYLKAEKGKTYIMSFEMKATEINPNSWVNNVIGFDAVTESGDVYKNRIPGTNGDINTLTSVLDTHIGRAKYLTTPNEWVTIETMATATDDGYFMFQLGWAHEWGQVSVRNFSVRELGEPVLTYVNAALNGDVVTVTAENLDEGSVVMVSVNKGESVVTKLYEGEALTYPVKADAEAIEVFVWKSVSSMQPVVKKITVK